MRILEGIDQGSEEWNRIRGQHNTASEAPVVVGASSKVKRNELVHIKATGDEKQVSDWVQVNLFDKGHEVEALGRPIAEEIVGEELYPATAVDDDDYLLASFDGITMLEDQGAEIKQWNEAKAAEVREGRVPAEDYWQVVQQLMVSGARRWLYLVTDGTRENSVHCWVELDQKDADRLIASWKQFEEDVKNYVPAEPEPDVVGQAPESLPALRIEVSGQVTASNLPEFKQQAMRVLDNINTDLQTDEDFANAELTVKWSKEVEARLEAEKRRALSQTASIEELFLAIDEIKEYARQKRLNLEKQVKGQKEQRRGEILHKAKTALSAHIGQLNQTLGSSKVHMPEVSADFAGAMKGKRTIASLRDAADTELARAKIEANAIADKIRLNLQTLREDAKGYEGLFADAQQLVLKENEDLKNLIKLRITEHQEAERKREEAIRAEERERAERVAAKREPAVAPQPSQTPPAARPASQPAPGQHASPPTYRPSDGELVGLVSEHYGVKRDVAKQWLIEFKAEAA